MKHWITWLEYPQLDPVASTPSQHRLGRLFWQRMSHFWTNFWDALFQPLVKPAELRVWRTRDNKGNIWWSAHDPATGRLIERVSEAQIRIWLEQRYQ